LGQPSVAIVILNFNGKKFLEQFLPSVFASSYSNKKIIIADNASSDDSVLFVQQNFSDAEMILLEKNFGFAEGYNQALKNVKADYYVLLNSDVEVTPNWIEPIIALMETDEKIAACQPKLLSFHQKEFFEYAGAAGGWIDLLGYPFARGRVFDTLEQDKNQYDNIEEIFWASGAAMFVRAKIYHALNGFDGYFFAHHEEIDLCWRMQRAGYKIMSCPASIVYHVGGGTLPKGHRKTFLNFRNNLIMLSKNLPANEKIWKMPKRIFLDNVFAWKCLLSGDANAFGAIMQAHFALLKWWFGKKNKTSLPRKPALSLKGVLGRSLIWEYFIKKKKSFSEIVDNKV
jgi:GT2 family glycosyltransferase